MAQTLRPKSIEELNAIIRAHREKQVVNRARGVKPLPPLRLTLSPRLKQRAADPLYGSSAIAQNTLNNLGKPKGPTVKRLFGSSLIANRTLNGLARFLGGKE